MYSRRPTGRLNKPHHRGSGTSLTSFGSWRPSVQIVRHFLLNSYRITTFSGV
jgi:hypothetical protein